MKGYEQLYWKVAIIILMLVIVFVVIGLTGWWRPMACLFVSGLLYFTPGHGGAFAATLLGGTC